MTKLIALGGLSGAGKTTMGYALRRTVPALVEAAVLDEDQVRRDLLGYDLRSIMPQECYRPDVSQRVRTILDGLTREALGKGRDVIDTSGFWRLEAREHVATLAASCCAVLKPFWLNAPRPLLEERISRRVAERRTLPVLSVERGHASDADLGIFVKYAAIQDPSAAEGWFVIDASGSEEETLHLIVGNV